MNKIRANFAASAVVCLVCLVASRPASADSISVAWDSSMPVVAGYAVYVTPPGGTTSRVDVGGATLYTYSSATAGQQYCFTVAAYMLPFLEGPKSSQVCGYSNAPPTLANPGNQTSTVGQPDTLQLQGLDPTGQPLTYMANGLPPGLAVMVSTGFISGTPTTAGTYSVTAQASDGALTASQAFTWTVSSGSTSDVTPPTASITGPTSAATYTTASSSMGLSGTAVDNIGVTQVTWVNDRGGNGVATGTTSWNAGSIALQNGANRITVTARDAVGNLGTDVLTVTYNAPSGGDTTPPTVSITGPVTTPSYVTPLNQVTISGTSADNVGVTQLTWTNSRGGSGVLSSTANWSVYIPLQGGVNVLTVTARDAAGNTASAVLTATSGTSSGDSTAPTATISSPTASTTYATTSPTMSLGGTASDNVGVTQVTWANSAGGSGTASLNSGTWTIGSVALQPGTNTITVTARDAAGNLGTDALGVTYTAPSGGDTTPPTVSITGPVTTPSYVTPLNQVTISGTSADNVGVTQLTWANSRGGSGVLGSTTNWSVYIPLQSGINVLTVTARDAAGNTASAVLTATSGTSSGDSTAPTATISGPTSSSTYTTTSATTSLNGTASDNVAVTQVTWTNSLGGSGTASLTASGIWTVGSVALQSGGNVITVTARDAAGNQGTDVITVTRSSSSSPLQLVSVTTNKTSPQPAWTYIDITANVSGGTAPYQYKWTLYDGVTWTMVQNWTTNPTFTWRPTTANSAYRFAVWVRSANNTADAPEVQGNISFPIN